MSDIATKISTAMAAPAATTPEAAPTPAAAAQKEGLKEALGVPATKVPNKGVPEAKPATKEATPAEVRKHKLKVDNEEVEVDDDELKRGYAHNKAASKRMEEAAAYRKQAEQAFAMLKDPAQLRKLLEDPRIGVDFRKVAEDYLWEKIQDDQLTPEQKKQREVEVELSKYRESEKAAKADAETREAEALQNKYAEEYETKIMTALEQGGLPKTRAAVRRMAQYLQLAVQHNLEVTPQDLVARVKQELMEEHKSMYSTGDASALVSILGEDLVKKLREADLKRLKSTQPESQRKPASQVKPKKSGDKPRQRVSADLFKELLTEKLGKG